MTAYHEVPPDVLENAPEPTDWARRAIQIAAAGSKKSAKKKPKQHRIFPGFGLPRVRASDRDSKHLPAALNYFLTLNPFAGSFSSTCSRAAERSGLEPKKYCL